MMAIFSDMVEKTIKVLMEDFSILCSSFDKCLENGQAEVSNGEIKSIMEKRVKNSRKNWSKKIEDSLWAYRTSFKNTIGYVAISNCLWKSMPPADGIGASNLLSNSTAEHG